jgi:hypothetical protein
VERQQQQQQQQQQSEVAETPAKLVIVDWDDTVLPTSYLDQQGILRSHMPLPDALGTALRKYAKCVEATFELLSEHGQIVIVSNAKEGWIDHSCARFLPSLAPFISVVPRMSAQPCAFDVLDDPTESTLTGWKEDAFHMLAEMYFEEPAGQPVFSLGDAIYERNAVRRIAERLGVVAQSAKLLAKPTLKELEAQHAALQDGCLRAFLLREDSFDIHIQVEEDDRDHLSDDEGESTDCLAPPATQDLADLRRSKQRTRPENLSEEGLKESQKSISSLSTTVSSTTSESARLAELSSDWPYRDD